MYGVSEQLDEERGEVKGGMDCWYNFWSWGVGVVVSFFYIYIFFILFLYFVLYCIASCPAPFLRRAAYKSNKQKMYVKTRTFHRKG